MPPRLVVGLMPRYIWNRPIVINQRRRHLMPLAGFDVAMIPPNPDVNEAVAPHPNMALGGDAVVHAIPPRLVVGLMPRYIWNRNRPPIVINQRRRHLMPLAGFDVVMTPPNPDVNVAVAPHPNMALVGNAVNLQRNLMHGYNFLREIVLHVGPNGLNILHVRPLMRERRVMVLPNRNYDIPRMPPEINLNVRGLNRVHVAAQHNPPNQNAPPIGRLVRVQQGPHVLVVSNGAWDKTIVPPNPDINYSVD